MPASRRMRRAYEEWKDDVPPPTDGQMKLLLVDALHDNPMTAREDIDVDVVQAVVVLGGCVSSDAARRAAVDEASAARGVVDVKSELRLASKSDN